LEEEPEACAIAVKNYSWRWRRARWRSGFDREGIEIMFGFGKIDSQRDTGAGFASAGFTSAGLALKVFMRVFSKMRDVPWSAPREHRPLWSAATCLGAACSNLRPLSVSAVLSPPKWRKADEYTWVEVLGMAFETGAPHNLRVNPRSLL